MPLKTKGEPVGAEKLCRSCASPTHYNPMPMNSVTYGEHDPRLAELTDWLRQDLGLGDITLSPASADASFRRYFRADDGRRTRIVMDAPPDREDLDPFVRAAAALAAMDVIVPEVLEIDRARGFLLLTDLGSTHYLAALADRSRADALYGAAIEALLKIQIAGREAATALPAYGVALLDRDVQLLPEWFVGRHLAYALTANERDLIERWSAHLARVALEQPQVFVHRDFHSRNLMVLPGEGPGILDFQDAIRGAVTYDLVSLFKDCYIEWPRARVLEWVEAYRCRLIAAGQPAADAAEFIRWFDLMGLQRHLKVLGIFARLWYRDAKPSYLQDLPLVLRYVLEVTALYPELAEFDAWLHQVVVPRFAAAQVRALTA